MNLLFNIGGLFQNSALVDTRTHRNLYKFSFGYHMVKKKNNKPRSNSSARWLQRQSNDVYVKRARAEGLRSRAAFKIEQLDQRDKIFRPGQIVLDLGAAPGGWCEYIVKKTGSTGNIVAIDILEMRPIAGVSIIQGDMSDQAIWKQILDLISDGRVDVVVSDMSPSLSGIKDRDEAQHQELIDIATRIAIKTLRKNGIFAVKLFESAQRKAYMDSMKPFFRSIGIRKPDASRAESKEIYMVAKGFIDDNG